MSNGTFYNNSVFWVEVDRISPNPYQPRREFDPKALEDLADSIKQYGVLQPLVVTRKEVQRDDGSLYVEYELIAGERRLRAAKLAGLHQVPVLIRAKEDTDKVKLELAIIENLQREDLNPIDRAKAFKQLADEFGMSHAEIAKKIGKSREYVSNTIRLLALPEQIQQAVIDKKITEGHARALLMLSEKPQEQETLFKEVLLKKMNVREVEKAARSIATERARKKPLPPQLSKIEKELTEELGTRVQIQPQQKGGKIQIEFFTEEDLENLLKIIKAGHRQASVSMDSIKKAIEQTETGSSQQVHTAQQNNSSFDAADSVAVKSAEHASSEHSKQLQTQQQTQPKKKLSFGDLVASAMGIATTGAAVSGMQNVNQNTQQTKAASAQESQAQPQTLASEEKTTEDFDSAQTLQQEGANAYQQDTNPADSSENNFAEKQQSGLEPELVSLGFLGGLDELDDGLDTTLDSGADAQLEEGLDMELPSQEGALEDGDEFLLEEPQKDNISQNDNTQQNDEDDFYSIKNFTI